MKKLHDSLSSSGWLKISHPEDEDQASNPKDVVLLIEQKSIARSEFL